MYFIVKIHRTFIIGVSRWHVDRLDSCHVFAFPILATTIVTTGRREERRGEEREGREGELACTKPQIRRR